MAALPIEANFLPIERPTILRLVLVVRLLWLLLLVKEMVLTQLSNAMCVLALLSESTEAWFAPVLAQFSLVHGSLHKTLCFGCFVRLLVKSSLLAGHETLDATVALEWVGLEGGFQLEGIRGLEFACLSQRRHVALYIRELHRLTTLVLEIKGSWLVSHLGTVGHLSGIEWIGLLDWWHVLHVVVVWGLVNLLLSGLMLEWVHC